MQKQAPGTTLRLDSDINDVIRVRLAESRQKLNPLVNQLLRGWLAGQTAEPPTHNRIEATPPVKSTYRPENKAWHDRLELVLNDSDEALGIQKNLEWAEKTVLGKRSTARRTASG